MLRSTGHPLARRVLGHGEGYAYPHDDPAGFDVDHLPDELKGRSYYEPRTDEEPGPPAAPGKQRDE